MFNDKEYQIENLERIFNDGALSPVFKWNPKYPVDGEPRIAYRDVMNYKYILRNCKESLNFNAFWSEEADIIVEYKSIEELVDDGWRLD